MPPTSSIRATPAWGSRLPRSENIRALVAEGNEILVQVVKDPLGTKGARLTTYITLPSRYLVYMPQGRGVGVSARIENEAERERLRSAVLAGLERGRGRGLHRAHGRRGRAARGVARRHDLLAQALGVRASEGPAHDAGPARARRSAAAPAHSARPAASRRRSGADRSAERASRDASSLPRPSCPMPCRGSSCTPSSGRFSSCTTSRRRFRRRSIARCR